MTELVRHFPDLGYTALVKERDEYWVTFDIHNIGGEDERGEYVCGSSCDAVPNEDSFEVTGTVRWDGCSNWNHDDCCIHFCAPEHARNLGEAMYRCYAWAKELLPRPDW